MWDARFEAIKDRKLNELVIFAALVRTDFSRKDEYTQIIRCICTDLEVIDAICEGKPVPDSDPIISPLYRGRLSKMELYDEYCLDECRKNGGIPADKVMGSIDAPEEKARIKAPERISAIQPPEEPMRLEKVPDTGMVEPPEEKARIKAPERLPFINKPEEPMRLEASPKKRMVKAPEEPVKLDRPEPIKELPSNGTDMRSLMRSNFNDSTFDLIISVDDAVTLKKVREMKDAKMDQFIDYEMTGRFKDKACEAVISFLKTDVGLIDLILSINITSKSDIETKIREIIDYVNRADQPKYQKVYLNSLDNAEKDLEREYNAILKRLEDVMAQRYSYVLGDSKSLFFE
jgi:hypothetical protein